MNNSTRKRLLLPSKGVGGSFLFLLLSLFPCCTGHPGEVRIKGQFEHLEQGEFLIYSTDEELDRLDTLRIQDGAFSYRLPALQTATLHILYPNASELVVFANPGADILVKGDARNLNEVEVSGSEDNESYTKFRLSTLGKSASEQKAIARDFILEYASLDMSRYLFTSYFLCDSTTTPEQATELYDSLCHARPDDLALSKLASHVRAIGMTRTGNPLPDFSLTLLPGHGGNGTEEQTIQRSDYEGKLLLIVFWAGWKSGSTSALYRARRLRRELEGKGKEIHLISYSLDVDKKQLTAIEERDTVDFPSYCDFRSLASPLVKEWGIRDLPYIILATPDGRIAASGNDWLKDIEPVVETL